MTNDDKKAALQAAVVIEKVTSTAPAASPAAPSFPDAMWIPDGVSRVSWISLGLTSLNRSAVIGRDVERATEVAVGELERCGGLYVLGQPRSGKSNLLISLALADIQNGHGILFIDPHTDAINDLVSRIPASRREDVILLDPTERRYSFGINPLHCADATDPIELDSTVGRVQSVEIPYELMVARRLYAIETWIALTGLAIYLAIVYRDRLKLVPKQPLLEVIAFTLSVAWIDYETHKKA